MSIIEAEARESCANRFASLSDMQVRDATPAAEYQAGYRAGALREPTDMEVEAMARVQARLRARLGRQSGLHNQGTAGPDPRRDHRCTRTTGELT